MQKKIFSRSVLISSLVLLSGCQLSEWFKKSDSCTSCEHDDQHAGSSSTAKASDKPIVSFNGKTVVTAQDFDTSFQLLMQSQQGMMQVLPMMPEDQIVQLVSQIVENLAAERIAVEWVKKEGFDKTEEYQKNARMIHDAIDRDLAARTFQNELVKKIQISDDEAKKFYTTQRDTNPYLKRPPFVAGTPSAKASYVLFTNEKDASAFLAKAKPNNFAQSAKDAKLTVKELNQVTAQTDIDNMVKSKILTAKVQSVELVKGLDGKFYVIFVASKQEPQAAPFDEVKDRVKELMLSEKFQELYQKELEALKKSFGVTINKDFVKEFAATLRPEGNQQAEQPSRGEQEKTIKPLAA